MSLLAYYLNILAKKDYSIYELRKKAKMKGHTDSEIQECIKYLQLNKFVCDLNICKNVILSNYNKRGSVWIEKKCLQKGIPKNVFQNAREQVEFEEDIVLDRNPELIMYLNQKIQSKYGLDALNKKEFENKILNYLAYQGLKPYETLELLKKNKRIRRSEND